MNIKLGTFESQVLYFNGMYKLPVAPYPTVFNVVAHERSKGSGILSGDRAVAQRLQSFKRTLLGAVNALDDTIYKVADCATDPAACAYHPLDLLTELATLLGNIQVCCASEMVKFGIPLKETMNIIMDSKFKSDGSMPDDTAAGFAKGPAPQKPEPAIKEMLSETLADRGAGAKTAVKNNE